MFSSCKFDLSQVKRNLISITRNFIWELPQWDRGKAKPTLWTLWADSKAKSKSMNVSISMVKKMKRKLSIAWKRKWSCWIPVLLLAALIDMKVQMTIQTKKYFFISKVKSVKGKRSKISTKRLLTWYVYKKMFTLIPPSNFHTSPNWLPTTFEWK